MNLEVATEGLKQPDSIRRLKNESKAAAEDTRALFGRRPKIELCLDECIAWIKKQEYEPHIETELISSVSKYPHSALRSFMRSLPQQVSRINRARRQREGVLKAKPESPPPPVSNEPPPLQSSDLGDPFGPP
jgi:hypothetical protein